MFSESGRHQFLPIYHSRAMTEPVYPAAVVVFVTLHLSGCPVVTCEYVGHLMFSLPIEPFLGIDISFLLEMSVWCSCLWSLVCCDASLYAFSLYCRAICSFILVCSQKMLVLTVVGILSSCKPLFAAWSAFSFPGTAVWAGIQLIVSPC